MADLNGTTFAAEIQAAGADLDPVRANLLLAREIAYPDLRPEESWLQIDDLRAAAQPVLLGTDQPALALAHFLSERAGFRGDREHYHDPRNSYLNDVLERRLGLPISLSVLYVTLARGLGLRAFGVGLPGHFVAGVELNGERVLLDPFNGGRTLSPADCQQLVEQATGHAGPLNPRWLKPTAGRDIVARMLNNLRASYMELEAWAPAIRAMERLRLLQPEQPTHLRDLGLLHYKTGAHHLAAEHLGHYLALAPNAPDAEDIRRSRQLLLDEGARWN
ncbi:MAG: tetratricopeptide repeat protein [Anaerolineales bacterium]|nr:tetratricopeptide repeat protein [Anaerolineales bacterium]